ncbi:MAG TPA: hypothetical protein DCO72_07435 [Ruminococcus sp.]|nr:hypothetical protein [Ruminococcus sp.]
MLLPNNNIQKILHENGWSEDRKVNIDEVLISFNKFNYHVSNNQKKFLENFFNLEITLKTQKMMTDNREYHTIYKIQFFPVEYSVIDEFMKDYEKYTKVALIPIGGIHFTNVSLLMDSNLKIYGVAEYDITLLGNNIFDALENLYENKEFIWDEVK